MDELQTNINNYPCTVRIQIKLLCARNVLRLDDTTRSYNYAIDALNDAKVELGEQTGQTAEAFFITGLICKNIQKSNEALVFLTNALNIAEILYEKTGIAAWKPIVANYKKQLESI